MPRRKPYPKGAVCKPCWELHYCPYGYLVEYFPGPGAGWTPELAEQQYNEALRELSHGTPKTEKEVWDLVGRLHFTRPGLFAQLEAYEPEDVACRIFGHTCPVFFARSGATETAEGRVEGRHIPRQVMLQVVRRDNHVCQVCLKYVRDDEVEFDHIIPLSKGGPTTVQNLQLLCRKCNRKKSNALDAVLGRRKDG